MKLAILHCGHPKTGTSSLQRYLAGNAVALARHGILYPELQMGQDSEAFPDWFLFQHGRAFKQMVAGKEAGKPTADLRQLEEIVATRPHDVLLLSSEYLFSALFYAHRRRITDWLRDHGYRIETVTYLRNQTERFASTYAQMCKSGRYPGPFDDFLEHRLSAAPEGPEASGGDDFILQSGSYEHLVAPGHHDWGTHTFRPFSAEVRGAGIEPDFMRTLRDILHRNALAPSLTADESAGFIVPGRSNDRDTVLTVALMRTVNRVMAERRGFGWAEIAKMRWGRTVYPAVTAAIAASGVQDPKYQVLTPERFNRITSQFAQSNDDFARIAWGTTWSSLLPTPDPAGLQSNDLDDTHDPVLLKAYRELLPTARAAMRAAQADYEARMTFGPLLKSIKK